MKAPETQGAETGTPEAGSSVVKRLVSALAAGSVTVSWGRYGGWYLTRGYSTRLCLGRLAITYFPDEIEDVLDRARACQRMAAQRRRNDQLPKRERR